MKALGLQCGGWSSLYSG